MRKIFFYGMMILGLAGCASVSISQYIQDKNPYTKKFYNSYKATFQATEQMLRDLGWEIEKQTDPSLYEHSGEDSVNSLTKVLIFTKIRQTALFLGSRYSLVNIYLRSSSEDVTEVEIRYLAVDSTFFKNFYHYKNDKIVERMFHHLEDLLK